MRMLGIALLPLIACLPTFAYTDSPRVVTDIAPVHSLVAQIMDGVGEPELLLPATASPHDYAMRPSDARRLQNADVVFWVGDALTPWLRDTLETLAADAVQVSLLDAEGTLKLDFREGAVFGETPDDQDHASGEHDDQSNSGTDPHAWLDPFNAKIWLAVIASELSRLDPENAATFQNNLVQAQGRVDKLLERIADDMQAIAQVRFVVLHDGFRYFEDRFGVRALGAIAQSDAAAPSATRVRDIRRAIDAEGVSCLFTEAQLQSPLLDAIAIETQVKVLTLDPLGILLAPGKDLYFQKLENIAKAFSECR